MQYDLRSKETENFRSLGFNEIVRRCVDRASGDDILIEPATLSDITAILESARSEMTLASPAIIASVLKKNPDCIRLITVAENRAQLGLFAYLPLNGRGYASLIDGRFDGAAPDPAWIAPQDEEPEALYIWLVWLPGSLGRSMGAIAKAFQSVSHRTCPVFSRAVTGRSAQVHQTMGFLPARDFYPSCHDGLLVAFPQRALSPKSAKPEVRIARTMEDMMQVMSVRSATYIAEQFCLYEEEFDGNDFCSTHFLGTLDGDPAGCIRIRFFADFAKIERLAVRTEYRTSRLAFHLVRAAVDHCRAKGYRTLYGHSRLDLVRFWSLFGFRIRTDRQDFTFANVRYAEMILETDRTADAIGLDAPPMALIRPEGAWDRPGPLDHSKSEHDPRRKELMQSRMRTVRNLDFAKQD